MYVCMYVCMHVCMYVCVHTCICVCPWHTPSLGSGACPHPHVLGPSEANPSMTYFTRRNMYYKRELDISVLDKLAI